MFLEEAMNSKYEELTSQLKQLKFKIKDDELYDFLKDIDGKKASIVDGLLALTEKEIDARTQSREMVNIHVASFPFTKSIDDYNFGFQPSVNESQIRSLCTGGFVNNHENVVFLGNSGVGKTHLSVAIGIECIHYGISTYFIKTSKLIENLRKARDQNRLEERLKHYCKYQLLIIDELGYLPIDEEDSKLFFQLIDRRYERKSTIITTNISFGNWTSIFRDIRTTGAIVDRLLHHSQIVTITGKSYRLKDILTEE